MIRFLKHMRVAKSDCPFFINNQPAYATGTGIELETFELDLSGLWMILIILYSVSTANAYAGVTPQAATKDLIEIYNPRITLDGSQNLSMIYLYSKRHLKLKKSRITFTNKMLFMLP